MEVRAKQHGDGTADPNYYLRYQLSWLGKTYAPTRWVDYRQTQDGLLEYLGRLKAAGQRIDKAGQVEFRRAASTAVISPDCQSVTTRSKSGHAVGGRPL